MGEEKYEPPREVANKMSSHDSSPTEATELPSLATIDTSSTNNINMKQYVSVKQSLPKTRLTSTILYENTSHDRHLELKLASLEHRRERTLEAFEITRRAFIKQQAKKRRKWMREDEIKLSSLNLPSLSPAVVERRPSVEVVYHCILNNPETETKQLKRKPVLPMLKMRKERTEIVSHHEKTFLTRLPSYVEIDYKVQNKFDSYRGKDFLNHGYPCKDERFVRLHTLLQPRPRKKRLWEIF